MAGNTTHSSLSPETRHFTGAGGMSLSESSIQSPSTTGRRHRSHSYSTGNVMSRRSLHISFASQCCVLVYRMPHIDQPRAGSKDIGILSIARLVGNT
ncbi:hypothetical protein F4775DRAFT_541955 [Biscogniauxia sp. FL1348]|nr:hypothetical protein F4775DRAFT_541955 [Biscogniauxia sp. FL1348]